MNIYELPGSWAGTEQSLDAFLLQCKAIADNPPKRADYIDPEDNKDCPDLFDMQGEVGVITIAGSLVNTQSWINQYFGRTAYADIREALIYAANSAECKAIVLDIKSGGGAVSGCSDTAELIQLIDSKVKPVHAFSDGMIASAAYWLGCSARSLSIGKTTEAGSIGVLAIHQENSKMLAEAGITTTVIRSGKYKALGISQEKLSTLGEETIQAQVDQLAGIFTEHVAGCRKKTAAQVDATMGQGRVFIGQTAVDVGLVDAVTNFDALMGVVTGGIAISQKSPQYGGNSLKGTQLKTALTEQQVAAIASGATLTPVAQAAVEVIATTSAPEPDEEEEVAAAAPAPAPAPASLDVVALLQTQLAASQAQVLQLSIDLQGVKTSAQASAEQADKMRPVVRAAVGNMRVALGGNTAGVDTLADDGLMAEYANLSAQFSTKFKAGGVAAVSSTTIAEQEGEDADPLRQARLASTRNR